MPRKHHQTTVNSGDCKRERESKEVKYPSGFCIWYRETDEMHLTFKIRYIHLFSRAIIKHRKCYDEFLVTPTLS